MSELSDVVQGMQDEIKRLKGQEASWRLLAGRTNERLWATRAENKHLREALARCSKICSQTGLMAPDGDWARVQVIDTVEEALKEAK